MIEIEYLTDKNGEPTGVVIPIELWRRLLPKDELAVEELSDAIEDYCMNKAMDEGKKSPLWSREEAIAYLEK